METEKDLFPFYNFEKSSAKKTKPSAVRATETIA